MRSIIGAALLLASIGCGENVDVVIVAPGSPAGALGAVLPGSTGRFYEDDKLYAYVKHEGGVERLDVTAHAVRAPLVTTTMHVVNPWAAVHDDIYAKDRGRARIPFARKIDVVASLPMIGKEALLLVDNGKPAGFVRKSDVSERPPVAKDLALAGKAALLEKDLATARAFGESAIAADKSDQSARRLAGAMLNHAGDTAGWALWSSSLPAEPPVDVPAMPAAKVGPAWVTGANVSLREKAATKSTRLDTLETGALVNVVAIEGDWAKVDRALAPARRLVVRWDDVVDGGDPWRTATADAPSSESTSTQAGYIALKLLSSTAPDPVALKGLGMERANSGDFDRAIVPLSRALSLRPDDDEVRNALYRAAVETERYTLALQQLLERPAVAPTGERIELVRVLGCFGDVDKARDRIETAASAGVTLVPPEWIVGTHPADEAVSTFEMREGSLSFPASESACLVDDEPHAACLFRPGVMDEQMLAGSHCGHTVEITPEMHARFLKYEPLAQQAAAEHDKLWPAYLARYEAWAAQRDQQLSPRAVVVRVSSDRDQPARLLGLYKFHWNKHTWCGDIQGCARTDLEMRVVNVPPMPAGTPHELWVEGVDPSFAWGAVLLTSAADGVAFQKAATEDLAQREDLRASYEKLFQECGVVPQAWRDRAAEAGSGRDPCGDYGGCCGC